MSLRGNQFRLFRTIALAATTLLLAPVTIHSDQDCNGNFELDDTEIARGRSPDCNRNGIPDECDVAPSIGFETLERIGGNVLLGHRPQSVALTDLTGEGDLDIAALWGGQDGWVSVLVNSGVASFQSGGRYDLGVSPTALAPGDLDGDARPDLVATNHGGDLSVLRNRGDGRLSEAVQLGVGQGPISLALGDLDDDADVDVAVANRLSGDVWLLRNDGSGGLARNDSLLPGLPPESVVVADFTGDGNLDLAAGGEDSPPSKLVVYLNDGGGNLVETQRLNAGFVLSSMIQGDLDQDGAPDLAAAHLGAAHFPGSILLFMNLDHGTFAEATALDVPFEGGSFSLDLADFDGDGRADLVAAEGGGIEGVSLYRNLGNRSYAPKELYIGTTYSRTVVSGDLDRDGDMDVVTGGIWVLINRGNGTFPTTTMLSPRVDWSVLAVDLDRDGRLDLAAAGPAGVLWNSGGRRFSEQSSLPEWEVDFLAAGDLDGDGEVELATADYGVDDRVVVLWNAGGRNLGPVAQLEAENNPLSVAMGDLDRDGQLDLAVTNYSSATVSIFWNRGMRSFSEAVGIAAGDLPRALVTSDLDGDGYPELALVNEGNSSLGIVGSVAVLSNRGKREIALSSSYPVEKAPLSLDAGDLDLDGDADLVAANAASDSISVLMNDGKGGFRQPVRYGAGNSPWSIAARDFDGDRDLDLAVAHNDREGVGILWNDGKGVLDLRPWVPNVTGSLSLSAGDLDGDGDLDVAVANGGNVMLLWNRLAPRLSKDCDQDLIPDECQIGVCPETPFIRGDSNSSGRVDLSDAVFTLSYLFLGGEAPACNRALDADGDGATDISDATFTFNFLFLGGPALPVPFPECAPDAFLGDLPCLSFPACTGI